MSADNPAVPFPEPKEELAEIEISDTDADSIVNAVIALINNQRILMEEVHELRKALRRIAPDQSPPSVENQHARFVSRLRTSQ